MSKIFQKVMILRSRKLEPNIFLRQCTTISYKTRTRRFFLFYKKWENLPQQKCLKMLVFLGEA